MTLSPGASGAPSLPTNLALLQVRAWIADKQLVPGGRLPAERELARRLGVTRFVVRSVLAQLESEGVIRSLSERIRVVADESSRGASVMDETVALFTHLTSRPIPGEQGPAGVMQMLYMGVSEALQARGVNIITVPPERSAMARIQRLIAQRPLAWIVLEDALMTDVGPGVLADVCARGIPAAVYGDVLTAESLAFAPFDVVSSDQAAGSYALTTWLIKQRGLRRVVRFSDNPGPLRAAQIWRARREQGYRDACRDAGIAAFAAIEGVRLEANDGSRQAFDLQVRMTAGFLVEHLGGSAPVDGLLVVSDGLVFDVAAACRLLGKDPQREIAVVGYDNYWMGTSERRYEAFTPPATVDRNLHEVGRVLVALALDRAEGRAGRDPRVQTVPQRLVIEPDA
jgi:DNA-binding LacI/PurR family transcriptional regulator